jgi:hypothetical protein
MKRTPLAVALAAAALALTACQSDLADPTGLRPSEPSRLIIAHGDGSYFVGKGDVQLFFGWNNQALQKNAGNVQFRLNSSSTTEWTCTRTFFTGPEGNEEEKQIVQERHTQTSTQSALTTQGRDISEGLNGPNTGFNVKPVGTPTIVTEGPAVGSCPAEPSGFVYDDNAVTTSNGGSGLEILLALPGTSPLKSSNTWLAFP